MESSDHVSDEQLVDSIESLSRILSIKYRLSYDLQEEIKQEISIALLKARERFDHHKSSWETYAYAIAHYVIKDFYRETQIQARKWDRRTQSPILYTSMDDPLYERRLEPSENEVYENLYINEFLEQCKTPKERFIVLCLLAGFTQADIERMMKLKPGNLSKSIRRLRIASSKSSSFAHLD